jgi:hypothetical protein
VIASLFEKEGIYLAIDEREQKVSLKLKVMGG